MYRERERISLFILHSSSLILFRNSLSNDSVSLLGFIIDLVLKSLNHKVSWKTIEEEGRLVYSKLNIKKPMKMKRY
jgi:hypothetical protein